ncbi:MAG TPA: nucleoside-diphosphate sugar epimerase/dehydratase [Thermotogota bacterium]|nr:polysaccharide biosynthesis protein [Thermotogota bacterium]HNW47245.1 nucleoside-diphosphate sugar epimerase/dehydratase [Thermotogota bacterium]HOF23799.1 nucleoside-diphosphate sugar epimerase/dehydratase [Thermotogota bacterium]HOH13203.1 nucleoside-diphosphate sugar epimerase/dehydratase [Thermotogota bacterium]HOM54647.1 nucleoside-diphosphate sugar epimerase/dehydratase [Thermotogota bacterium]
MKKRRITLWFIDTALILLSGLAALFIRFGWDFASIGRFTPAVLVSSLVAICSLFLNGIYRIVWAYMTTREIGIVFRAFALGYLFVFVVDFSTDWVLPRSIGIVMFMVGAILVITSRMWWSWYAHREYKTVREQASRRIAIIGAGESGVSLSEDLRRNPQSGKVVLFIDDSERKIGREIRGIRVLGPISRVNDYVKEYRIDELLIAMPSAPSSQIQRVLSSIDLLKVKVKILPNLLELIDQQPSSRLLREISIVDLLGRDQVAIDLGQIKSAFHNKTVMVTGAGGSIGSEITRQVATMGIKHLLLLGRGENSIYEIDQEMTKKHPYLKIKRIIADITDQARLEQVFETERPQFVFHAAAHKHVPLMEENPSEAFRVNSIGTKRLLDLSLRYEVEGFLMISSDKAVKPSSIMGVSKRMAEMYIRAKAAESQSSKTRLTIVRFGNVLGSRGSIIPKFERQIKAGGPVTITHPEMRRFFMTIEEASSLVLQTAAFKENGSLYVLDMGEMVYIKDLVEKMISLAGYVPGQDIQIVYTGCREGEKLYEELFTDAEKPGPTAHPKIFRAREEEPCSVEQVESWIFLLYERAKNNQKEALRQLIHQIIPENCLEEGEEYDAKRTERVSQTQIR